MRTGRPALPVSVKIARGTYQKCRDASRETDWTASSLTEPAPADLGLRGRAVWASLSAAGHWLAETDWLALELVCKLADFANLAEARYRETGAPADGRIVLQVLSAFAAALGRLGFDPSARARLGLAEIDRATKLQRMMRRAS